MFQPDLFNDKIVLVTGGRSGIGYAISKLFLKLGAQVYIASRKGELLQKASEELAVFGNCHGIQCDIRNSDEIKDMAGVIRERSGRLDILINNAGGQFPALAEMINDKGWNAVINNNLNGTFYMCREMAKAFFMPQKDGIIINIIADILRGFPGMMHTGAARAGVENITKTLALEWSGFGIRTLAIAPGTIESSGLDTYPQPIRDMFEDARKAIPMNRFGTVDDIAYAVCFFASPMASYISGVTLYVDGAQHLNGDKMGLARVMRSVMGG